MSTVMDIRTKLIFILGTYDPENPYDAEILLSFLNDDSLDQKCERVLAHLEQFSDLENSSDNEEVIKSGVARIPTRTIDAEIVQEEVVELQEETEELPVEIQNEIEEPGELDIQDIQNMNVRKKCEINWNKGRFLKYQFVKEIAETRSENEVQDSESLEPIDYFYRYITEELFTKMAEMTNMYALQQGKTFKNCNSEEIRNFFGLHIMMSCLG